MKERIQKLQKAIPQGTDAVLITSPINRRYYTGFPSTAGVALVFKRKAYFIVDARYFEAAKETIESCEVILQDKLSEQMVKLLKQHKAKTLGIESQTMTVSALQNLQKNLEDVEIITGEQVSVLMNKQRAVKTEDELVQMRAAQKIADAAFQHLLEYIEAGRTELEVAAELEIFCKRNGSQAPSFDTIIASGPNSAIPHWVPGNRVIQTGDFVKMDFGCMVGGYCSDMTRTVAVGAVTPEQREVYETVLAAQLATIKVIKAGVKCADVDKVARDIIDASEFRGHFSHSLGHCVGLEIHEEPRCNKLSQDTLEVGMVTSVEPGIYLPGKFGVRIEDCVVVTKKGSENLCASPKELIIL